MTQLSPEAQDLFDRARDAGAPSADERDALFARLSATIAAGSAGAPPGDPQPVDPGPSPAPSAAPPSTAPPATASTSASAGGTSAATGSASAIGGKVALATGAGIVVLAGLLWLAFGPSAPPRAGDPQVAAPRAPAPSEPSSSEPSPNDPSSNAPSTIGPAPDHRTPSGVTSQPPARDDSAGPDPALPAVAEPARDDGSPREPVTIRASDPDARPTATARPRRATGRRVPSDRGSTSTPADPPDGRRAGAGSDLAAELALLDAAQSARRSGDSSRALRALGDHAARFPRGILAQEREVLRATVLCEGGDLPAGRAIAARFASTAYSAALRGACALDGGENARDGETP